MALEANNRGWDMRQSPGPRDRSQGLGTVPRVSGRSLGPRDGPRGPGTVPEVSRRSLGSWDGPRGLATAPGVLEQLPVFLACAREPVRGWSPGTVPGDTGRSPEIRDGPLGLGTVPGFDATQLKTHFGYGKIGASPRHPERPRIH